jgi:hypothetical protein
MTDTIFPGNVKAENFEPELNRYLAWCLEHDEIAHFKGLSFVVSELDGKEGLAGVVFEDCFFPHGIELSNMRNAKIVDFRSCRCPRMSGVDMKGLAATTLYCTHLILTDDEDEDEIRLGAAAGEVRIQSSAFEHMIFVENNCDIELHRTHIAKEIKISGVGRSEDARSIHLSEVDFHSFSGLTITNCDLEELVLVRCRSDRRESNRSSPLFFLSQRVQRLEITGSVLPDFTIDGRNSRIGTVSVSDSTIGGQLDLRIATTLEDEKRTIGSVKAIDSFLGESLFEGRILNDPLDFTGTTFATPPQLHGVAIPPGSIFPGRSSFQLRTGEDAVKAYRTLRFAMEGQRARSEEGMFFTLEQETILNTQYPDWRRILSFNFWYGLLSEYGTNAARPMGALLALGLSCAIIYALICSPELNLSYPFDWTLLSRSILFSLQQICTPFLALRELKSPVASANDVHFFLTLVATVESLGSVILITLSILALRWEFKRG